MYWILPEHIYNINPLRKNISEPEFLICTLWIDALRDAVSLVLWATWRLFIPIFCDMVCCLGRVFSTYRHTCIGILTYGYFRTFSQRLMQHDVTAKTKRCYYSETSGNRFTLQLPWSLLGYPDGVFSVLFPQLKGKRPGKTRKDGHGPHSSKLVICVVLLLFVLFYVLFVCKCVLYYCHRVLT